MIELLENLEFWHWFVLAAILLGLEVFISNTVFLWLGIAAAIVGGVLFFVPGMGWEMQVFAFSALSVICVFVWRHYAQRFRKPSEAPQLNRRAQQYVGREFTLTAPMVNRRSKIKVDDSTWIVEGDDLEAGAQVRVVDVDGVILKVEKV